jgi:hypothetical protein
VSFDPESHTYLYRGRQLSGVTTLIAKALGLRYPAAYMEEYREEGVHVHQAVQNWINTGDSGSVHPGVLWIISEFGPVSPGTVFSEVLVSDMKRYASAVDILRVNGKSVDIYDVKNGTFKRDYVTWQLSIYKYFIDAYTEHTVNTCVCISVKDQEFYEIYPKGRAAVEKLLYNVSS